MHPETRIRKLLPNVLIAVGAILLLYVAWSYLMMWHEQRALSRQWHQNRIQYASTTKSEPIDDGLVRVLIPKANVDAIVVDGVTRRELSVGPGHIPSTPMPGTPGNSVITAHRDTFFRRIGDLSNGDQVIVHRAGKVYYFAVTGRKIVEPDDLSVLRPTRDAQLTLITCYPTWFIGPAPERLIVTSQLVRSEPDRDSD